MDISGFFTDFSSFLFLLLLFFLVELNFPHGYDTYLSLPLDE